MGFEKRNDLADCVPQCFDGALCSGLKERFELGKGISVGLKVQAIGRVVEQLAAGHFNSLPHAFGFMRRQGIHHDRSPGISVGTRTFST